MCLFLSPILYLLLYLFFIYRYIYKTHTMRVIYHKLLYEIDLFLDR